MLQLVDQAIVNGLQSDSILGETLPQLGLKLTELRGSFGCTVLGRFISRVGDTITAREVVTSRCHLDILFTLGRIREG